MSIWIGLFRGINVGGNNILPMKELVGELEALKLTDVRTYIQSGNVVFSSSAKAAGPLTKKIVNRIEERFGFAPQLLLLNHGELMRAVENNPFPQATSDPKSLHFFFLTKPARQANLKALDEAKAKTESFQLTDHVFYLHAPDGIGRSKLAASAERQLGVVTTARNYRTVEKVLAMATEASG